MQELKDRIVKDGEIYPGDVLKVSSFLNHQLDTELLDHIGREIADIFFKSKITKILTIEASGIAIAMAVSRYINVPIIFAKKNKNKNMSQDVYSVEAFSYTKGATNLIQVEKRFISKDDSILIVDDFLAKGSALNALTGIVKESGANLVGCAIAIEKVYQGGGAELASKGVRIESLAKIKSMSVEDGIVFEDQEIN